MNDFQKIIDFILENFDRCFYQGGGSSKVKLPEYELMPYNFIDFAKNELDKNTNESLINCIGHLKRAIDCELDKFLFALNILDLISRNNLGFEVKLKCIELTGMFSSKSLQLLNLVRNKMEHEYSIPKIENLQVHYELCNAFILVVESYVSLLSSYGQPFEWYEENSPYNGLSINFDQDTPELSFKIIGKTVKEETFVFKPKTKETINNYLKALNIFFILCRSETTLSDKEALKLLKDLKDSTN